MKSDNRTKKSDRLKKYFAETARAMILKDGVESLSVRKIAKEAGYAYATIYNHFKNLDELLWLCRSLMIEDVAVYINSKNPTELISIDNVIDNFKTYTGYFLQNPNIFKFFYFHKLERSDKKTKNISESEDFNNQMIKTYQFLKDNTGYTEEEIPNLLKLIIYSIHGLLTLSFSENDDLKQSDIEDEIESLIRLLLNRC